MTRATPRGTILRRLRLPRRARVPRLPPVCAGIALAAATFLLPPAESLAIQVIPAEPTDQDTVKVRVGGWFGDVCWEIFGHQCARESETVLLVRVSAVDNYAPGMMCADLFWDYERTCSFGLLAAGEYTAAFVEYRASVRDPEPRVELMPFSVRLATPTVPVTWGRIRALYR